MLRAVVCPSCGTHNNPGAKFCQECATPLATTCPSCGTPANPGAKFCQECAAPLMQTAPQAAAAQEETASTSERKLVTVLFADLVGFTPFAEERDAEDVRDTLSRYFDLARDVIERYGGTVEKFIGDAVMAVWGAPVIHEDDAELCVRAGLELVEAVTSLGDGIQARCGILTGEAAVTIGATNQGMVAGDLVNTASRLQSVAAPGTVLVGESTQRAAAAAIAFEAAGDQTLKGKQAPVPAWRAVRIVGERGGRNRAGALEAPFVGRQEELRLLKELFHATGREKRLRVVSVVGPAGIGKSRLSWEFSKYLDGVVETIYWHRGRSPAYGEGITFWALGEMVRERCGLAESDDPATTRAKVREQVEQWVTDPDERAWIERALLTLLGVETGMASDQLFGAWRTFFERIAEQGTVVLLFEDMHFADAGLLDFVDHLLEWSRGLPIYVVTLARPELIERRPAWGAGKRNFVSLYLEPLSAADMRELLAGLVPGLPDSAVSAIVARADGIPLYAVETVRTLVADGRLVEEGGIYVPRGDLTTLSVPDTLTALIAARLDALDETDRRIVHDAAVLGQSFTPESLAAVSGLSQADLEPRLTGLARRELLRREMDPRSPERGQYTFVQALIREVAYNTLSKKDRKKLHLAAARYYESLGSDEIAGALAAHYLAAHANAGEAAEADALAGQARIALKAAAARASSLGSYDQAQKFYEDALAVTTDGSERPELMIQASGAARAQNKHERAQAHLRDAIDLAAKQGNLDQRLRATARLGWLLSQTLHAQAALDLLQPAVAEASGVDEATIASLKLGIGRAYFTIGGDKVQLGAQSLEDVLLIAERRGLLDTLGLALISKSNVLFAQGRRREGAGLLSVAYEIGRANDIAEVTLRSGNNLASIMTEEDQQAGMAMYDELMAMARKVGRRDALLGLVSNYAYTAFLGGEWDAAMAVMEVELAEDMAERERMIMLNNASIIRANRGEAIADDLAQMADLARNMEGELPDLFRADPEANLAMASGDLKTASARFFRIGDEDPAQLHEYAYRAARPMLWAGDVEAARRYYERFAERGSFGPVAAARIATIQAGLAALEGRAVDAMALYREGLRGWRETHSRWDEALTGIDMATLLDPTDPEVAEVIRSTREILEGLRATPYVAILDRAAARQSPTPARKRPAATEVAVSG